MTTTEAPRARLKTVFIAVKPDQVLTRKPVRFVPDGENGRKALTESEWIARQEEENEQRRIAGNPELLEIDRTPWKVEFIHHIYEVPQTLPSDDQDRIAGWLRGHRLFNSPEGFYEQGHAPDEPKPTLGEQMSEIAAAGAARDLDRLDAVIARETETHERPDVLAAADAAIVGINQVAAAVLAASDAEDSDIEPPAATDPSD